MKEMIQAGNFYDSLEEKDKKEADGSHCGESFLSGGDFAERCSDPSCKGRSAACI